MVPTGLAQSVAEPEPSITGNAEPHKAVLTRPGAVAHDPPCSRQAHPDQATHGPTRLAQSASEPGPHHWQCRTSPGMQSITGNAEHRWEGRASLGIHHWKSRASLGRQSCTPGEEEVGFQLRAVAPVDPAPPEQVALAPVGPQQHHRDALNGAREGCDWQAAHLQAPIPDRALHRTRVSGYMQASMLCCDLMLSWPGTGCTGPIWASAEPLEALDSACAGCDWQAAHLQAPIPDRALHTMRVSGYI